MAMAELKVVPDNRKKRIIMLRFMAHGHLNPFMALARKLVQRENCTITIVNTPLDIQKLKSSFLYHSEANMSFAEVPFNTAEYGIRRIQRTQKNPPMNSLSVSLKHLQISRPPSGSLVWLWYGVHFSLSLNISQIESGEEFSLLDFTEALRLHQIQLGRDLKYVDDAVSFFSPRKRQFLFCLSSDAILLNGIEELDKMGAAYFHRRMGGRPVYMIGPVCSFPKKEVSSDFSAWLDLHPPRSVLYVCFGSQLTILPSQMRELAKGSKESGVAFIWVIRPPFGFSATAEFDPEWGSYHWLASGGRAVFNSQFLETEMGVCLEMARGIESATVGSAHVARIIRTVMGRTDMGLEMSRREGEIQKKMEGAFQQRDGLKGSSVSAMDDFLSTVK
ncbi:hypothetical protein SLEP1_g33631 [Rubroshorea leprosula]|uniref:Uncharacterized protein n=1 Tax=Rubroshorea leprosula TaxID=152421 RepID=A0AAV5KH83_9ROSI|nr:hypothetical protein SLEP1_g33631 [Rubroshorea leprosula]